MTFNEIREAVRQIVDDGPAGKLGPVDTGPERGWYHLGIVGRPIADCGERILGILAPPEEVARRRLCPDCARINGVIA